MNTRVTEKSKALLYKKGKQPEKYINESTPFTTAANNINYIQVMLKKQVRDLFVKKISI